MLPESCPYRDWHGIACRKILSKRLIRYRAIPLVKQSIPKALAHSLVLFCRHGISLLLHMGLQSAVNSLPVIRITGDTQSVARQPNLEPTRPIETTEYRSDFLARQYDRQLVQPLRAANTIHVTDLIF
jgi:hypothetical protein